MRVFGVVVGLALVASACSGGSASSSPTLVLTTTTVAPTTSITEAPTTTAPPTTTATTLSPEEEAEAELRELAMAYLTYENNELEEGRTEPWPKLALTTGRLFDRLSIIRAEDLENDHYLVGAYENSIVISVDSDLTGHAARIDFCTDDGSRLIDADGAEIIGRGKLGGTLGYLLAVGDGDGWLLEELIFKEESCGPDDYSS